MSVENGDKPKNKDQVDNEKNKEVAGLKNFLNTEFEKSTQRAEEALVNMLRDVSETAKKADKMKVNDKNWHKKWYVMRKQIEQWMEKIDIASCLLKEYMNKYGENENLQNIQNKLANKKFQLIQLILREEFKKIEQDETDNLRSLEVDGESEIDEKYVKMILGDVFETIRKADKMKVNDKNWPDMKNLIQEYTEEISIILDSLNKGEEDIREGLEDKIDRLQQLIINKTIEESEGDDDMGVDETDIKTILDDSWKIIEKARNMETNNEHWFDMESRIEGWIGEINNVLGWLNEYRGNIKNSYDLKKQLEDRRDQLEQLIINKTIEESEGKSDMQINEIDIEKMLNDTWKTMEEVGGMSINNENDEHWFDIENRIEGWIDEINNVLDWLKLNQLDKYGNSTKNSQELKIRLERRIGQLRRGIVMISARRNSKIKEKN